MRNFITKFIERLRGFHGGGNRAAATATSLADATMVLEEHASAIAPERFDSAVLASDGIHFHGIRYQSADLAEMQSRMSPGATVKVMIKDPSDRSRIYVRDDGARQFPVWISVTAAAPEGGPTGRTPPFSADDIKAAGKRLLAHIEERSSTAVSERPRGRKPSKAALAKATKTRNAAAKTKVAKRFEDQAQVEEPDQ